MNFISLFIHLLKKRIIEIKLFIIQVINSIIYQEKFLYDRDIFNIVMCILMHTFILEY